MIQSKFTKILLKSVFIIKIMRHQIDRYDEINTDFILYIYLYIPYKMSHENKYIINGLIYP